MGAKTISLGERSYPPTREVMDQKGILPLLKKLNVQVINFDDLEKKDWVLIKPNNSHWKEGFRSPGRFWRPNAWFPPAV